MIPKIIHLCWLSGDPFPTEIERCLKTWNDKLKGYTVWLWGKAPSDLSVIENINVEVKTFDLDSAIWTKEAFDAGKYAFAADYIRLYALYNYGGIYLDADVVVYKSFDELLHLPYFIGCDQIRAFEAAVIGAEKGCQWIKDILDTYTDKHFVKADGSYDMMELPVRFHHVLVDKGYKFVQSTSTVNIDDANTIHVFPHDFFNGRDAVDVHPTKRSFCSHNYMGSWQKKAKNNVSTVDVIKQMMPKWLLKTIYVIGQNTWARNKYSWFQIRFEEKK